MDTRFQAPFGRPVTVSPTHQIAVSRFISKTYGWMMAGLVLTGMVSWMIAGSESAVQWLFGNRWVFPVLMVAELGVVFGLSMSLPRMAPSTALLGFLFYSALNGVTFSTIFLAYTMTSVAQVFFVTAGMFGGLALIGTVTKKDLTAMGTFFAMGLWGLILLGIVNIFAKSASLSLGLGLAGVLIFSGLTAWDAQKIKWLANQSVTGSKEDGERGAIMGALMLYLDFINLFLSLLRIMGNRRE